MKVYEKVVIDIESGAILEERSFQYTGPLARCEPITASLAAIGSVAGMGTAMGGLTVLGTAASFIGTIFSSIQQSQAAHATAAGQEMEAKQQLEQSREVARRRREEGESQSSKQIAQFGASGLDLLGSPLDVIIKDAGRAELYAQDALYEGRVSAAGSSYEAKISRWKAGQAMTGGFLKAGTTLLGSQTFGGIVKKHG